MLTPSRAQTLFGGSVSSSFHSSQASSTGDRSNDGVGDGNPRPGNTNTGRARKSDLASADKANVNRAADLLIVDIIDRIGWDPSERDFVDSARDCLAQACVESGHR